MDAPPLTDGERSVISTIQDIMMGDNTTSLTSQIVRDHLANRDININVEWVEMALRCMWYINNIGDNKMSISYTHDPHSKGEIGDLWYELEKKQSQDDSDKGSSE